MENEYEEIKNSIIRIIDDAEKNQIPTKNLLELLGITLYTTYKITTKGE